MGRGEGQLASGASDSKPQTDQEWLPFAEVSHLVGMQTQYASRYHTGSGEAPVLSEGLRITELDVGGNYHALRIHPDDVEEMARRIVEHRISCFSIPPEHRAGLEENIAARRRA